MPAEHSTNSRSTDGEHHRAVPRSAHAHWMPAPDRPDPVKLLLAQDDERLNELVVLRNTRMAASPAAYLRGSADLMAGDLAHTPNAGIRVQACGDAHIGNFGIFATPERN